VAIVSGLTDVDAITLSTAELVGSSGLATGTAWRVVMVAMLSNLLFKGAAAGLLGGWPLFRRIIVLFGIPLVVGVLLLAFWPDLSLNLPLAKSTFGP
jgi:uncharacterized membrane protein (DUF4010 family)